MKNMPNVKLGLVAVSRDCFPIELSRKRRVARRQGVPGQEAIPIVEIQTIVENEKDALKALDELEAARRQRPGHLSWATSGPKGRRRSSPRGSTARSCSPPRPRRRARTSSTAAATPTAACSTPLQHRPAQAPPVHPRIPGRHARRGRGHDRRLHPGGPHPARPQEAQDLRLRAAAAGFPGLQRARSSRSTTSASRSWRTASSTSTTSSSRPRATRDQGRRQRHGQGARRGERLPGPAGQARPVRGGPDRSSWRPTSARREYGVFANKCWPAFETYFGFVPCYVNSRLATRGIPVSCEVDIYGALSEYMATCATELPATLLDINNTVPYDMFEAAGKAVGGYKPNDLFMGFHCGNTSSACLIGGGAQVPAHHAPADGARERAGHHPRHARRPDQGRRHHDLPPAVHGRSPSSAPTWPRARCWTSTRSPSAGSASSPSRRWAGSTATS